MAGAPVLLVPLTAVLAIPRLVLLILLILLILLVLLIPAAPATAHRTVLLVPVPVVPATAETLGEEFAVALLKSRLHLHLSSHLKLGFPDMRERIKL